MENVEKIFIESQKPANLNEGFKIDSLDKAEWAINKIKERRAQRLEIAAFFDRKQEDLEIWFKEEVDSIDKDIEFFVSLLQPFAAEQLKGKKTKTMKLPSGSCSFRKGSTVYRRDEAALLELVRATFPEYLKIKESVDWSGFKKTLTQTEDGRLITSDGEVLNCVICEQEADDFIVKTEV